MLDKTMKTTIPAALFVASLFSGSVHGQTLGRPTIQSPVNNARVTTNDITITGRTTPNSGVTSVQYTLDGQGPFTATQLNAANWNKWEATVPLTAGFNQFLVWATGAGGSSPTNSANYFLVVPSLIKIATNGDGMVLPDYNGGKLHIGQQYTIFAVPGKGHLFTGWSGSVASSDPILTFLMRSNMQLTATFVPSPYGSNDLSGPYGGLFWNADDPSETNAGLLTLTLASNAVFTGEIRLDGGMFAIASEFGPDGTANVTVRRHGKGNVAVALTLDLAGVNGLTGTIYSDGLNGAGAFTASLQAYRDFANTNHGGKSVAGNYTLAVSGAGSGDPAAAPQGFSYGAGSVNAAGLVNLRLFLSDGSTAIFSGNLTQNAYLPLYASLDGGAGSILGWVAFTNGGPTTNYQISWFKDPVNKGAYTNGFSLTGRTLWVDPFHPPAHDTNALGLSNAVVQLTGGDLTLDLNDAVTLNAEGVSLGANSNQVKVSLANHTGIFSGSFVDPIDGQTTSIHGVALESMHEGLGYFLGTNDLSGAALIGPPQDGTGGPGGGE
jgi:hypothetical protein